MITSSKAQHAGKRKQNNDDFLGDDSLGLYVLCDGSSDMYGRWIAEFTKNRIHEALKCHRELIGSYNSKPNVTLRNQIAEQVEASIQLAASDIMGLKLKSPEKALSYTTLDLILILKDSCLIAHIGNGRVYLIREDRAKVLTEDDTLYALKQKQGIALDHIKEDEKKHLTKVLGKDNFVTVKVHTYSLISNDIFIVCTDGFYFSFENYKIFCQMTLDLCKKNSKIDSITNSLITHSVKNGADDNTSVILISNWSDSSKTEAIATDLVKKQIELIRNFRMFRGIRENDYYLLQVHSLFTYIKIGKGLSIVTQGDESTSLFIVLNGKANVLIDNVTRTALGPGVSRQLKMESSDN